MSPSDNGRSSFGDHFRNRQEGSWPPNTDGCIFSRQSFAGRSDRGARASYRGDGRSISPAVCTSATDSRRRFHTPYYRGDPLFGSADRLARPGRVGPFEGTAEQRASQGNACATSKNSGARWVADLASPYCGRGPRRCRKAAGAVPSRHDLIEREPSPLQMVHGSRVWRNSSEEAEGHRPGSMGSYNRNRGTGLDRVAFLGQTM